MTRLSGEDGRCKSGDRGGGWGGCEGGCWVFVNGVFILLVTWLSREDGWCVSGNRDAAWGAGVSVVEQQR